ncbi:MAG: oligosaccharide flippase family protein [Verrucomicrobiaceae bacterium]|nr:oligosaccharide flippase family protein [Verrucomicrobiaceae bacterium]
MSVSMRHRLLSASALSLVDQFLKVASALVISPVIIHALGVEGYGEWMLAVSFAGYFEMLDLGFSLAAVRFYSKAIGAADHQMLASLFGDLRRHYRRLGSLLLITGLGGAAACVVFGGGNVMVMVCVLALANGVVFWNRAHAAMLKARMEYGKVLGAGMLRLVLFSGFMLLMAGHGMTAWTVLGGHVALQLGEQCLLHAWAAPFVPKTTAPRLSPPLRRDVRRFSFDVAVGGLTQMLRQRVDTQILAGYSSMASVSHYLVAARLPLMFFDMLNGLFGGHVMAGFSQMAASSGQDRQHEALFRMLRISAAIAVVGAVGMWVFGPVFLGIWVGDQFEPSHEALQWLAASSALTAMHCPLFSYFGAINAYGKVVKVSMVTSLANFITSLLLVQRMGLMGVVWGTVIENVLWGAFLWPVLARTEAGFPLCRYLRVVLVESAIPFTALAAATSWLMREWLNPASYWQLIQCGLGIAVVVSCAAWFLLLAPEQRLRLRGGFH